MQAMLALIHSDIKTLFSQPSQYISVHQQGDCNTEVSGNVMKLQEVYIMLVSGLACLTSVT